MAYSFSQTIVRKYGFKTTWEIDEKLLDGSFNLIETPLETIDGMPGVKWYLLCDNEFPLDFYLTVQTENEVESSLEYQFLHPSMTPEKTETVFHDSENMTLLRIEKSDLQDYVKDGKVTIELEASFSFKNKSDCNFYNFDEAAEFGLRLKQKTAEDFDILVDGQSIEIHKIMLAVESPVFERMFESNFKKAEESKVTIPDFKLEIVKAAIDYYYRQDITLFLNDPKNAMELLRFCDKYDFQTLKPKLEKHLALNLSKENVFYIASKAEEANAPALREACINFIKPLLNNCLNWPLIEMTDMQTF